MATILDKDLTRESTIKIDDREINITITAKQEIRMKLKGMKSGELTISIEDLYKQLSGGNVGDISSNMVVEPSAPKVTSLSIIHGDGKVEKDNPMINLHDLRSLSAVSCFDLPTLTKFDGILAELIKNDKERKVILKENSGKKK